MVPARFVGSHDLRKTDKIVRAANGAVIPLLGEATFDLHLGGLSIPTTALVSEHVTEGTIGYDWLSANNCQWKFGSNQIIIRDVKFQLHAGTKANRCCRIMVQDEA